MTVLDDLRPKKKDRLIDLVRATGVDVSDWKNFKLGKKGEAKNPKYCYEWCFIEPGLVAVFNLWHSDLKLKGETVSIAANWRQTAARLEAKGAKTNWITRSNRTDDAFRTAAMDKLPIRVIINDGTRTDGTVTPHAKPSRVKRRELDPVPWVIQSYDDKTGQCVLVRGERVTTVDQFDLQPPGHPEPQQVDVHGKAFVRSEAVRRAVLARANGRCEFCGEGGFELPNGDRFLETHHIVPLSEKGPDTVANSAAICANHHREAHHGANAVLIRERLLAVARTTMTR